MKRTAPLQVLSDFAFKDGSIVIHPNTGADLGLMTLQHEVRLFFNIPIKDFVDGSNDCSMAGLLTLSNNCRNGFVEMSQKRWTAIGRPRHVLLIYDSRKLLVYCQQAPEGKKAARAGLLQNRPNPPDPGRG
jgi:hypothetical protein